MAALLFSLSQRTQIVVTSPQDYDRDRKKVADQRAKKIFMILDSKYLERPENRTCICPGGAGGRRPGEHLGHIGFI